MCGLVLWVSGLVFGCLDLYSDVWTCILGVWTCLWVSGLVFGCLELSLGARAGLRARTGPRARPRTRLGPGPGRARTRTRLGPGQGRAQGWVQGRAQGRDRARALRCLRQTSKNKPPRKNNIPHILKCVVLRVLVTLCGTLQILHFQQK